VLSEITLNQPEWRRVGFAIVGVVLGAFFAGIALPFAPFGGEIGSGPLRASLLLAMGACGIFASPLVGLQCWTDNWARAWSAALVSALGVTIFVIVVDCFLFRNTLSPGYVEILRQPLSFRLTYYPVRAYTENIVYRLFAMPLLVLAFGAFGRKADGSPADGAFWAAIVMAQVINIVWNGVQFESVTLFALGYDAIRYVLPGCLWGYLFWRYGFVTAEIGHVATHFFLQPAFNIWLQ
jgi:hypothetical protein